MNKQQRLKYNEYQRKWQKAHRTKNREYFRIYMRKWNKEHKEKVYLKNKKWRNKHKDWIKNYNKKYNIEKRNIILKHYGDKCSCCGETTKEFLAIDHINNDGAIQRKKYNINNIYNWIIKNNFPKDLQILCHNCNLSKAWYGYCPHNKEIK
jgi:hypothetical protein